ncbi:MAG: hypothetical protein KDD06_09580 [Phaeodactylibacter sp.]|nr:hypothetical protein [Phaeodactylibacter sp.]MCB9267064.1 hypothetical protein [Lewinellaceae bacterium]MCB9290086.1 hypothetical protein [Lewinellaceae bacterium]
MKNLVLVLMLLAPVFLSAQRSITWKGGTPGKASCWNEPANWDANRVPGENDHVIIRPNKSSSTARPVIFSEVQVASIEIQAGAELYIAETGKLVVDGEYTYSEGISIYGGKLVSEGEVILKAVDDGFLQYCEAIVSGPQVIYYSRQYDFEFSLVTSRE